MINSIVPHLGFSPDRRVYDPSESSPWGPFAILHGRRAQRYKVLETNIPLQASTPPKTAISIIFRSWLVRGGLTFLLSAKRNFIVKGYIMMLFFSNMMEKRSLSLFLLLPSYVSGLKIVNPTAIKIQWVVASCYHMLVVFRIRLTVVKQCYL